MFCDSKISDLDHIGIFIREQNVFRLKGTTVLKICARFVTTADWQAYDTNLTNWLTANCTVKDADPDAPGFVHSDGKTYVTNDGVSIDDRPAEPSPTVLKTGEITLVWQDDSPV